MAELRFSSPARSAIHDLLSNALSEASDHAVRLDDLDDHEAVHDFRVAVRRLRTYLRVFSEMLPLDDHVQLELRELTGLTNATRDAEAHSEWLQERLDDPRLTSAERHAVARTLDRLASGAPRPQALEAEARRVLAHTGRALARIEGPARGAEGSVGEASDHAFCQAAAMVLEREARRLHKRLGRIEAVDDAARIHSARLSEKRLRYVLEPVAGTVGGGDEPLERLKSLQDLLGELHDLSNLGALLTGTESELADVVRRRRAELFAALAVEWLGVGADSFFADIASITQTLREESS